ncbi:MAG: SIMPL domain-containing protein [Nanoarchaeota archaeon]
MDNKIIIGIVIVAILIVGGYIYFNTGPVVSAQGVASIKAMPDEVSVNVNVETRDKTAQLAQETNKKISDKLLVELIRIGYDRDELKFVNYYANPEYDWSSGRQNIKGYVVSQQLVVKTKDVTKVPGIIDAVISSGALVSYINFEISDAKQTEYKNKALEEASKDAMTKAQSIASGQGKKIGRLVSITNQDYNYPGPFNYYTRDASASMEVANAGALKAATNLAPNEQEITASILAEYRLRMF